MISRLPVEPDRVPDRDGPAVHVHLVEVGAVDLGPRADDRGEGLVDLEDVDVVHRHPGLRQNVGRRGDRAVEVVVGIGPTSAWATIRARGRSPEASARSRDIHRTAAAPSEICEELPAVCMPSGEDRLERGETLGGRLSQTLVPVDDLSLAGGPVGARPPGPRSGRPHGRTGPLAHASAALLL